MERQLHLSYLSTLYHEIRPIRNRNDGLIVEPRIGTKPQIGTGLWTSTWDEKHHTADWVEWCKSEFSLPLEEQHWYLLTPTSDARIFTIHTLHDLKQLLHRYQRTFNAQLTEFCYPYPDFERISQEYDAIHLTEQGQIQTHLNFPENLYGWDCESTLWFRWCFERVERI